MVSLEGRLQAPTAEQKELSKESCATSRHGGSDLLANQIGLPGLCHAQMCEWGAACDIMHALLCP